MRRSVGAVAGIRTGSQAWEARVLVKLDYGRGHNIQIPLTLNMKPSPPGSGPERLETVEMKRTVIIHLDVVSPKMAEAVFNALTPETKKPATSRSHVTLRRKDRKLTIRVEGDDTSSAKSPDP